MAEACLEVSANFSRDDGTFERWLEEFQGKPGATPKLSLASTGLQWKQVKPLCAALRGKPDITDIDVSENQLGLFDGLVYLTEYLKEDPPPPIASLDLSSNEADESVVQQIVDNLIENPNLRHLSLDSNQPFTPISGHAVANLVINIPTLTSLSLNDLQMESDVCHVLSEAVMHNSTLTHLSMDMNLAEPDGARSLGEMLTVNTILRKLDLSGNRIGEGIADLLCQDVIDRNTTLEGLTLARNRMLSLEGMAGIPKRMTSLTLSHNRVNIAGAVLISKFLESHNCLRILYFADNLIGDDGVCVLSEALRRNTTLMVLDVAENMITGPGCIDIITMLGENPTLATLTLDKNKLGLAAVESFERSAPDFVALRKLHVRSCGAEREGQQQVGALIVDYGSDADTESDSDSDT